MAALFRIVGQEPKSGALKLLLNEHVQRVAGRIDEHAIVHHFVDRLDGRLQLEVEFRSLDPTVPLTERCRFARIIL